MRTDVAIPDEPFEQAERLAKQRDIHRDELFAEAGREYVARHDPDAVTDAINRALELETLDVDPALGVAARCRFEQSEW